MSKNKTKKKPAVKYQSHSEAVVISCFYNPTKSEYRKKAFMTFYDSIKHLNYRIIECTSSGGRGELALPHVSHVKTDSKAWHKETLLNRIISELPPQFKYVFWLDADVLFTRPKWLVEGVEKLQEFKVIQPFEYGVHLEKDELKPSFDLLFERNAVKNKSLKTPYKRMWRSFAATWAEDKGSARSAVYDHHGHVGFAWGARRSILDKVPLFNKALIGGADHLMAHASVGQLFSPCIKKSFGTWFGFWWSLRWYLRVRGSLSYVPGDLYHIWHGDIRKREYLKRIRDFTPLQKDAELDDEGFYVPPQEAQTYYENYMENRERVDEEVEVTETTVSNTAEKWGGFGGGGDFDGGGAGGSWEDGSASLESSADASVGASFENFS